MRFNTRPKRLPHTILFPFQPASVAYVSANPRGRKEHDCRGVSGLARRGGTCPPSSRKPTILTIFLCAFASTALAAAIASAQNPEQLKAQGYVNDFANVLSQSARDQLTALCSEVEQKTQAQIAVVTVKSLGGRPIEQYSIDLATHLGVGPKKSDRGVMILLAVDDHKYRFEVGYGLEGILPDGKVGGFGREAVPFLRENNYDAALLLVTRRVADVIAADRGVNLSSSPPSEARPSEPGLPRSIEFIIFVVVLIAFVSLLQGLRSLRYGMTGRGRGGGYWIGPIGGWGGGGFGGSGWGGGSSGGGGFGGFGGGSFGGGGASGSW